VPLREGSHPANRPRVKPQKEAPKIRYHARVANDRRRDPGSRIADSQLTELRNMRVLLEEARGLARDLAYHRRARLEAVLGQALEEVDSQIEDLRRDFSA
jgi:hypothetical protein